MREQRRRTTVGKRLLTLAAVLAAAGFAVAAGKPGLLKTKSGVVYDGTIDEREQSVVVNVRGIETSVPRGDVDTITYGDFETRWNAAYAKLDKDDSHGRISAAREAFQQHRYDLA